MTTEENRMLDKGIPQWKRDLILRRRAVGRVLPTGSGSVQLTCPSVVAAVRLAEYSVNSDFLRRCESGREQTGGCRNMRLVEQVTASDGFVEPCVVFDVKEIITKIESGSSSCGKMGEEKYSKKRNNSLLICEKKSDDDIDDNASDSSEEFKYGPGIVSKLKSKYLSLTLRESQGRYHPLNNLRRATSLENILDEPEKSRECKSNYLKNIQSNFNENKHQRCRGLTRVNKDSMKRARSVEVLTRYDRGNTLPNVVLDEDETGVKRNLRHRISSSSVEEKELPPPDLVKHTLKIFESSHTPKLPLNIKKKNQKNSPDLNCAKKPMVFAKPSLGNHNSIDKTTNNVNDEYCKNKSSDLKNKDSGISLKKNVSEPEITCSKGKTDASETVIINNSDPNKKETEDEKFMTSCPLLKEDLTLDLTDAVLVHNIKLQSSPINSPSLKTNSDKVLESPEQKRSISPVLVRAPPCILSSELSSNGSATQLKKQVGVIRPMITNKSVHTNSVNKYHLTEREIEKNLINKVKSIEQPVTKVIVSLKKSPEECYVGSEASKENDPIKRGQFWDKKPNTMVFNFSNRKTIPDYIENDGLILASRKEKPKLEPGIILLSGGTEGSSTDFDPDELSSEPPLVCDVIFEGDNVLINGKSNIQSKPKLKKMKIQFNDEATTLFEYPSEASLLDDQENVKSEEQDVPLSEVPSSGLPNLFRCSSLASYTPSKVSLSTDFQLGITKTISPPTAAPTPASKEVEEEQDDEEGYLRPADENTRVSWSAETAADLLF